MAAFCQMGTSIYRSDLAAKPKLDSIFGTWRERQVTGAAMGQILRPGCVQPGRVARVRTFPGLRHRPRTPTRT